MKRIILLILIACLALVSCKKIEYVYIPKVQTLTRDSIVTKMQHDSIFIKVTEKQKNDTIYRDSIVYNYVFRNDTIKIKIGNLNVDEVIKYLLNTIGNNRIIIKTIENNNGILTIQSQIA